MNHPISGVKQFIATHMPSAAAAYDQARTYWASREWRRRDMRSAFHHIYEHNEWGDPQSVSGRGSSIETTASVRRALPRLIDQLGIRSLLDAPCGDYHWMAHTPLALARYVGIDIVPELVEENRRLYLAPGREFLCADISADPLPRADAILCRDCLVHMSFAAALRTLRNFKESGATFLLTTTFTQRTRNLDCFTGWWRPLNLQLAPFNLPTPLTVVSEEYRIEPEYADKHLGVWRLADIAPR